MVRSKKSCGVGGCDSTYAAGTHLLTLLVHSVNFCGLHGLLIGPCRLLIRGPLKGLLQYMGIGRLDAFIVVGIRLDDLKTEPFVELYGAVVVHLDVSGNKIVEWQGLGKGNVNYSQEYAIKVSVLLHIVQDMVDHDGADAQAPVGIQAAQSHDV